MAEFQHWTIYSDGVVVWDNFGNAPESPSGFPGGDSIERWYPNWVIRCSPWDNVFVWNTAGVVTAQDQSPGQNDVVPAGKSKRRRFILPDGTHVWASYEEVYELLETVEAPKKSTKKSKKPAEIVFPKQEVIKFKSVAFEIEKVDLLKSYRWKPDPEKLSRMVDALRVRDEEEAIVVLLLH